MPRHGRCLLDGAFYHILNRGNAKQQVFFDKQDYLHFLESVSLALKKHPVDVLAYCLMPNHFHFVVRAKQADNLSKWVHLLMTRHIQNHKKKYESTGHIWQGRYKDFIIQDEYHLLIVLRYVEANALRAGLVNSSVKWKWSSQFERDREANYLLNNNIVELPENWQEFVDAPLSEEEAVKLMRSLERQAPFGRDEWIERTAKEHGLEHRIRPRGRQRHAENSNNDQKGQLYLAL
jgi:putative transposase